MSIESTFPTEMASDVRLIVPDTGLGERADAAIRSLHEHGMVAASGLTEYHAGSLAMIAAEPHIVEYCRNDSVSRHGSLAMARKWHAKDGAVVL